MTRTRKLLQNLFDFERRETVGEIIFYRCFELVVVYYTIKYAWRWGPYMERLSDIVLPLGIAEYVDVTFMFDNHLGTINAILITVMVLVGYFRLWRYAYLATLLLFHLHYVARFSQGEISHGSNMVAMIVLSLAVATLAFEHRKEIRRAAMGLSYFFIGLSYTSAALCKLGASGPLWVDGRHLWMWIQERTVDKFSLTGAIEHTWLQELTIEYHLLATAILTFGLLVEFFAFLMWYKRLRPYVMIALVGMHLGIWGVMQITFSSNTYILLILAFPVAHLIDLALRRLDATKFEKLRTLSLRLT